MSNLNRSIALAAGLAALWVLLAVNRPTVTYHLAPLLVAGVVPFLASTRREAHLGVLAGAVIVTATTIGLGLAGHLAGPSLLPAGGAVVETWIFAAIGAAAGWSWAIGRVRA